MCLQGRWERHRGTCPSAVAKLNLHSHHPTACLTPHPAKLITIVRQPPLSKRSFRFPELIKRIQLPLPECISCQPVTSLLQLYTHMPALCHLTRMQMLSKEMHIQQCSDWVDIQCYINVVLKVLTNVGRLRITLNVKSDYIQYKQFHSGQISISWDEYQSKPGNSSRWHVVRKISLF